MYKNRSPRAATRKHTMVGHNYFKGGGKHTFGGKYTKSNKVNNNSVNFRGGARLLLGWEAKPSCGPEETSKLRA